MNSEDDGEFRRGPPAPWEIWVTRCVVAAILLMLVSGLGMIIFATVRIMRWLIGGLL